MHSLLSVVDASAVGRRAAVRSVEDQIRLIAQSRPAAETGFQQNETDRALRPVPDEADALRLQPHRAQSAQKIGQPLRLVDQKKASAPAQRACRCGAERVKGTGKLAAGDG